MVEQKGRIEPGPGQEIEIGGDSRHVWTWRVEAAQFAQLEVEQLGVDVEVLLYPPGSAQPELEVDGLNGEWGVERLSVVADDSAEYRIEIASMSPSANPGRYQIVASEPRAATDTDRKNVVAERRFDAAERRRREEDPANLLQSLDDYREALDIFDETGNDEWRLVAQHRLGWVREQLGHKTEARAAYADLLQLSRSLNRRDEEATTINRLGRLDLAEGRDAQAEERFLEAQAIAAELDDQLLQATCHNNLALILYRREDLAGALERFEKVRQVWSAMGRSHDLALTLHNMSHVLRAQGKFQDAIDVLDEARRLRIQVGDTTSVIRTALQLGDLYRRAGEPRRAKALYSEILAQDAKGVPGRLKVLLANNLGLIHGELGEPTEAAERFEEALAEAARLGFDRDEAMSALNLSHLRRTARSLDEALSLVRRARGLFEGLDDRRNLAACDLIEALVLRDQGHPEMALAKLEAAAAQVENLRIDHAGWDFRMTFFATRQTYYDELIDLLVELDAAHDGNQYLERALQASERRRARSLLDALAEGRLDFKGEPAVLDEEQRLTIELAEVDRELKRPAVGDVTEIERQRRRLLTRLESVRTAIRRSSPQYAELTRPEPLGIDAIRNRVLDTETRLLIYALGERRSFLWSVDRSVPVEVFELPGRAEIETMVEEVRQALTSRSQDRAARHRRRIERFADVVLGPLAGTFDHRRLAIVADGALHTIPFGALPEPASANTKAERRWLIEGREVVHLPSASSLAALRAENQGRPQALRTVAVFADPVFSEQDERFQSPIGNSSEDRELPKDLDQALRDIGTRTGPARLPATLKEARVIADLVPEHLRMMAVSFDASRETFEAAELEQYRVLHFATHGVLDPVQPELSGLVLSLFDEEGRPVDGFIRAHELYSRRLSADLVVLSACQTGLGREIRGEGLIGLPRGFLYAGVPRIVVSLWNVADDSTAELMASFYRELGEGHAPAAALRKAQLAMLASEDPEHRLPYRWAAFAFLGDWLDVGELSGGVGEPDSGAAEVNDLGKGSSYDKIVESLESVVPGAGLTASARATASPESQQRPAARAPGEEPHPPRDFVNGVLVDTGEFLPAEPDESQPLTVGPRNFRRLRHWVDHYHPNDPLREPMHGVDPEDLAQSGWAVIFGPDVTSEVREALQPLLDKRELQAGDLFERIDFKEHTDALTFLEDRGVAFGPAVPDKLPYYLLLVGDPARLPFEFQYQVDVQYAVGRLHFDKPTDYASYARSVLDAEDMDAEGREAVFWGTDIADEKHSQWMMEGLLNPLYEDLQAWQPSLYSATKAADGTRATLARLLSEAPPAFLFTASHGVVFPYERGFEQQREFQGALLCEDWQRQPVTRDHYFAAEDVVSGTDLRGLITAHFACYSAGCSARDCFSRGLLGTGKRLTEKPFVSRLCQRLLTSGAQAVVGHVDRAWETSFSWSEKDNVPRVFMSMARQLLEGHRLGHATEWIHHRYAECATELNRVLEAGLPSQGSAADLRQRLRKVTLDTRNYLVIGDPAVRLVGAARRRANKTRSGYKLTETVEAVSNDQGTLHSARPLGELEARLRASEDPVDDLSLSLLGTLARQNRLILGDALAVAKVKGLSDAEAVTAIERLARPNAAGLRRYYIDRSAEPPRLLSAEIVREQLVARSTDTTSRTSWMSGIEVAWATSDEKAMGRGGAS